MVHSRNSAAKVVETALLAVLPEGVPPSFRRIMWARFEGSGRKRYAVAGLMMFDGLGATVEVWDKTPTTRHRFTDMPGGACYWTGKCWARDTESAAVA